MQVLISSSCFLQKVSFLILCLFVAVILGSCIFDEIQHHNITKSDVNYNKFERNGKQKRSVSKAFEPIRIKVDYHDLDFVLTNSQQSHLKDVVSKTIAKAQNIFSVQRVVGNLLLSRSSEACVMVFQSGVNAGKCAVVRNNYKGEICTDGFIIPNEHVEGLKIYNADDVEPVRVIREEGEGLPDTDFVLYVRSINTEPCIQENGKTIAYATYCQLDQNNRPIAGYINFCPELLEEENYNSKKLFVTALHELFHSLGFSNKLFDKFQDCYSSGSCFDRQDTVQKVLGEQRIVTPKVVEVTSAHFNCKTHETVNEFGPMLEVEETTGRVNSHWDAAFMFSSIMTPTIGLPELTMVDSITLALFEDTGWYKVDYSQADYFPWGISGGCDWGRHPQCATMELDDDCFCTTPGEQKCHYLHRSKGTCKTDEYLHNCFVYKTITEDSCLLSENSPILEVTSTTGELYAEDSRCFIANLTNLMVDTGAKGVTEGRCYQVRCNGSSVEVKVGASPWVMCENETLITVPGYSGVLECPHSEILCPLISYEDPCPEPEPEYTTEQISSTTLANNPTTTVTTTATQFIPDSDLEVICIEIVFDKLDYDELVAEGRDVMFKEACVSKVQLLTGVKRRRISSVHLLRGSTLFRFDILPAQYPGDGPRTEDVIAILRDAVYSRNFTILLSPDGELYVASGLNQMDGGPQLSRDQTPKGVIAAMVVGSLVGAVIIGLAVFFVQRYYTLHSQVQRSATRRPQQDRNLSHQRRLSQESGQTSHSLNSNRSGTVVRSPIAALQAAGQPPHVSSPSRERGQQHAGGSGERGQRVASGGGMTGEQRSSQPGSRQRSPIDDSRSRATRSTIYTDVTRLSADRTPEQQHGQLDCRLQVQRFPSPQYRSESFSESPLSHASVLSDRDRMRRSHRESSSVSPELPARNTAVRSSSKHSQQQQKKPCIFHCKCAWFKDRLKSTTNKASVNSEKSPPQPEVLHESNKGKEADKPQLYPSVIQCCSPVSIDHNANFYPPPPQFIGLEDMVRRQKEEQDGVYAAPSLHTTSNTSEEDMTVSEAAGHVRRGIGGGSAVQLYDLYGTPVPGYRPNDLHIISADQTYQENPSQRISHYSSCNSFVDGDDQPTHKTCIEVSYPSLSSPDAALPVVPVPSLSYPNASVLYRCPPSTMSHTNSYLISSGSSSSASAYPKSSLMSPDSSLINSHIKPAPPPPAAVVVVDDSLFTVNGSHLDLDMSRSTLETQHSGSVAGATDTDVSSLARTVDLKGQRNSTNSWKSFSSDTSMESSAIKSKA